ncbi:MAG TPA: RhuM family protein, partial [Erysipelothrix sp.]
MNNIILYTTDDGKSKLELHEVDGQIWLTQLEIAELYQSTKQNISLHVQNILEEGELLAEATVKDNLTVQTEGTRQVKRTIQLYSLPMIIAIGYRVRSTRGTQFRKWATSTLQEYLTKGFVMDDERLKNPVVAHSAPADHFDELLERIRDIRASERRVYLRVREIFAMAAD